jgi:P pilus assembly chaperone PapD
MSKTLRVCLFSGLLLVGLMVSPGPVQAGVSVSPTSLGFGTVAVNTASSAATLVVTSSGQRVSILQVSSSLPQFVVTGPALPLTLGPHASVSFHVVFQPAAAVTYSGSIVFYTTRQNGGTRTISVSGTGINASSSTSPTYLLSANTSSLNFGNMLLGTSSSQPITLTNTGTGSVNLSPASITGAGFSVTGFSGAVSISAGQSLSLSVNFAPVAAGSVTGFLTVVSNATNSPTSISLAGAGVQPQISVIPSSINFGNLAVGVTNTQTVTIKNPGTANLSVTKASLAATGFGFSGLSLPLTVPPGGSYGFTISFTPTSASNFSGSLTFANNSPTPSLAVLLSGTGIAPVAQLTPSPVSLSFGSLNTGTSASQNVTLSNTGNSNVSLSQLTVSPTAFSTTGLALPMTLTPGQSASFSVTFAPTTSGSLTGIAAITSNAANSPTSISLSGSGTAPVSHSVALNWTPSASSLAGFNIYRGSQSGGPYTRLNSALLSSASYTDTNVVSGLTFYYVATEVNSSGTESGYSNEAAATIP